MLSLIYNIEKKKLKGFNFRNNNINKNKLNIKK